MSKSSITHLLIPMLQSRLGAVKIVVHDRLEFMDFAVRAYTSETEGIQIDVPKVVVERADSWGELAEDIVARFVAAGWRTIYGADWIPRVDNMELEEQPVWQTEPETAEAELNEEQIKMREEWSLDTTKQSSDVRGKE